MLYIFHVDKGLLMTFDMQLSVAYVDKLKEEIERTCCIPANKQVLLMSGGQCLENHARVCSFGTGTDTNPVYLFSREIVESSVPPLPVTDYAPDIDLKEQVDKSLNMPATYSTVVARAQLAQKFHELAREQTRICERLVLDQHRQQQGWAAVVANLEDIIADFKHRAEGFLKIHKNQLDNRERYREQIQNFHKNLELLSKIPVLPALLNKMKESSEAATLTELASDDDVTHSDNASETGSESNSSDEEENQDDGEIKAKAMTLFQWVSLKDNQLSLEQVANDCAKLLDELSLQSIEVWKKEMAEAMAFNDRSDMKEIKGLGDRLFGLEQLMCEARRIVQEQADLAHSFLQNQNRASNLGDVSILPDLCASHRRQLLVMLQNHQHLRDIRRRCIRAKNELCDNLHCRLRWVLLAENVIQERDCKLTAFTAKQNHLEYLLTVLEQIHKAPEMYVSAVTEVVRRRHFSQAFLTWASDLACHLISIHSEEVMKRTDFQSEFEEHFLNSLFMGMSDMPPAYATEPPSLFDIDLPALTLDDIEILKTTVPYLEDVIKMPDIAAITQFFQSKSFSSVKLEERGVGDDRCIEDRLVQVVSDVGLGSALDRGLLKPSDSQISAASSHLAHPHLKDLDRGFESETDTEEFEKVGQSPVDLQFDSKQTDSVANKTSSTTTATTIDVSTLTEDNLGTAKAEIDRLKNLLARTWRLSKHSLNLLKQDLTYLKSQASEEIHVFNKRCDTVTKMWERFETEANMREREKIQRLTVDHELEMNDIKNVAISKDDEIRTLKLEKLDLECVHNKKNEECNNRLEDLERRLHESLEKCEILERNIESLTIDHERSFNQLREQMNREHQNEIESLRSRFRLMTNMERSPSDTSLERIERLDVIELVNHESIIAQMKENFITDQTNVVTAAVEHERAQCNLKLNEELEQQRLRFELEKQVLVKDALRRVVEEKDKQIENLMTREVLLSRECLKYKEMINQLTDGEDNDSYAAVQPLIQKIEHLEQDKCRLEAELSVERSRKLFISQHPNMLQSMGASVAVCPNYTPDLHKPSTCDASTSTDTKVHRMLTSSQIALIQAYSININACVVGERALVVWDRNFQNYVLVMDSSAIFVLHADCIPVLGLKSPKDATRKEKAVGEVVEKEYCYAKKAENRYHFPKGTRFYRVKVRPLPEEMRVSIRRESSLQSGPSSLETSTTSVSAEPFGQSMHRSIGDNGGGNLSGGLSDEHQVVTSRTSFSQSCTQLSASPRISEVRTNPGDIHPVYSSMTTSLFGVSPPTNFSAYHSFSQPSSLVECVAPRSEPTSPQKIDDEVGKVNFICENESSR